MCKEDLFYLFIFWCQMSFDTVKKTTSTEINVQSNKNYHHLKRCRNISSWGHPPWEILSSAKVNLVVPLIQNWGLFIAFCLNRASCFMGESNTEFRTKFLPLIWGMVARICLLQRLPKEKRGTLPSQLSVAFLLQFLLLQSFSCLSNITLGSLLSGKTVGTAKIKT